MAPIDTAARVRKAVVPVAGLGTRLAPATKAIPKEMLPVVDRPAVEYVVDELAEAGVGDVVVVTGRGKAAIEDHFDGAPELEAALERKGDAARLAAVRRSADRARLHFVRQGAPKGTGHAVLQGRGHVGDEPFVVVLGDDLVDARDPLLVDMIALQEKVGGSVVALQEVAAEEIGSYGAAEVEATDVTAGTLVPGEVMRVTGLVEKPAPGQAPSRLAVLGRYVLSPAVFDALERVPEGDDGEVRLTDALQILARTDPQDGGGLHGVVFRGRRYDIGSRLDYLKTVVRLAADRDDLGAEFTEWLTSWLEERQGHPAAGPDATESPAAP